MKTQHTKGEWKVMPNFNLIVFNSDTGLTLARIEKWSAKSEEEAEANAKLIAAAPDMLEALKEAIDQLESWNQESEDTFTMKRIKDAIKKATE